MSSNTKNHNPRLPQLDGLRGLLSIIVALNHSFLVVSIPKFADIWNQNLLFFENLQAKLQQITMLIGNGGAAVTLFFILSGFVLGQSFDKLNFSIRGLAAFFIKRIIRLYFVYFFVLLLTAIYMKSGFYYKTFLHASQWFSWWMNFDMTIREFFLNLFFVHSYVGGVTWTLRVILIATFFFPVMYLSYQKQSRNQNILLCILLIVASFTVLNLPRFRDLRYLYMFYVGLCIPKFSNYFSKLPSLAVKLSIFPIVMTLLSIRYFTDEYVGGVIETIIGWNLIGLIIYHRSHLFSILEHQILKFLGKISYSLYLTHFSILYILARFMFIHLANLPYTNQYFAVHTALFIISLGICIPIAYLINRYIETPASKLGSNIYQKIIDI